MLTVLEKILDLPGFKITQVEQKSNELHIHLDHLSKCAQCPTCGNKSERFHQNHWRKVRDLPLSTKATFLYFSKRRFECLSCREVFSESLAFLTPHRLYTKRYEEYIYKLVKHNNVSYVKDIEDLSYEVIEKIFLSSQSPSSSKSF